MNLVTTGIGLVMVLYGVYTMIMQARAPGKSGKLKAMQARFGNETGMIVHITAYTILPFVLGMLVAFAGLNGLSLWDVF